VLYSFVILTQNKEEYLFRLKNYSMVSQTIDFLTSEIKSILEEIGPNNFCCLVTDNAANIRGARRNICNEFPHIFNIRCIAHTINLIATDIAKNEFVVKIISKVGKLVKFFKKSHIGNALLREGLKSMNISGGFLVSYSKIRWGSLFDTTNSVLISQPVFAKVFYLILFILFYLLNL